jgi:alpha-D-xyloside xylohydrolase
MRAMPLAFPESRLARDFELQFMCGDALLVAPIVREGGDVDIALPPGAWYDLNSRARYPGSQVLRYAARLDQFPVFGREGYALPLGRAVQHTGEMSVDTRFLPDFGGMRPHQTRLHGGDASSDSFCYA